MTRALWRAIFVSAAAIAMTSCAERLPAPTAPLADDWSSPVPFDLIDNRIVVDARFNGRPLRVIFDTGAGYILTPEAAAELGLDVEGAGQSGGAGEQRVDTGVTQVADMQIGDVHIRDHEYAVISLADSPNVFGSAQIDGVVGFEVLERFVTRIDYEERELSFMVPELFSYDGNGVAIPVQPRVCGEQSP